MIITFLRDERGQDLAEYSLLLAFMVLACAAVLMSLTDSLAGIWTVSNAQLTLGNQVSQS